MLNFKTILCPTDFSPHSESAFQLACALARDYEAKVVVLYVAPTAPMPFVDGVMLPANEAPLDELRRELATWHANTRVPVERLLVEGSPADVILRVAEEKDADVIVMGTHGRGPLRKLLMGSVAEAVIRRANCPVLTIRNAPAEKLHAREAELLATT